MHLEVEATGTTVPSVLLPAWYCCVGLNVKTPTNWSDVCMKEKQNESQRTPTRWAVEKPFTHVKVSSELFLFLFFYWHVPFSVGFFTSERTPRPAWWPQTLSEVKWNSQSSQLWKIPIVQNKMFDCVCVLLHRKMRTIPKNWSESNQQVTKMRYTAWQNPLWGRLKSTGSSRQSPALQNKSKHDFSWKKIWLFRPTNEQARGKTNWGWK